jgi:hypothetical protein
LQMLRRLKDSVWRKRDSKVNGTVKIQHSSDIPLELLELKRRSQSVQRNLNRPPTMSAELYQKSLDSSSEFAAVSFSSLITRILSESTRLSE